jgi:hypothetical protein
MHFRHGAIQARFRGVTGAEWPRNQEDELSIEELLRDEQLVILEDAWRAIAQIEHYRRDGDEATRRRVEELYERVAEAVRTRDLDTLLAHVSRIAKERFAAGYDLTDVHGAFTALEQAIWKRAVVRLPASDLAWGLGLVGTALSHAKVALGGSFVSQLPGARAGSVDLTSIFRHAQRASRVARPPEDLVYPV